MKFTTYDLDSSSYQNVKDLMLTETVISAKKASYLKKYLGAAEVDSYEPNGLIHNRLMKDLYLCNGEDYYNYMKSQGKSWQLPLPAGADNPADIEALDVVATGTLPFSSTPYELAYGVKEYEVDYAWMDNNANAYVTTNSIDLLKFIREYQLSEDSFRMRDSTGTLLSIETTIEWLRVGRQVLAEREGYIVFNPILRYDEEGSNAISIVRGVESVKDKPVSRIGIFTTGSLSAQFTVPINSLTTTATVPIPVTTSLATYVGDTKVIAESSFIDKDGVTQVEVSEEFVPEYELTNITMSPIPNRAVSIDTLDENSLWTQQLYKTLHTINNWIRNNLTLDYCIKMTLEDALHALDEVIEEANKYSNELDTISTEALKTPIGKILGSVPEVRFMLEVETVKMNEMWMHFRIHNLDDMNNMEDIDERDNRLAVADSFSKVPFWYKAVYPILKKKVIEVIDDNEVSTITTNYYVIGYAPNWKVMHKMPNRHFMVLMQMFGDRVEYGIPKPKKAWGKMLFAIVFIVVVSVMSYGTLTKEMIVVFGPLIIAGAVASIATILTGSKTWAKVGDMIGIATIVVGISASGIMQAIKNNIVGYVVQLITFAQKTINSNKIDKLQRANDTATDTKNEIEELVTAIEQEQKVQRFIYTDHTDLTYTHNYDYRYEWKYLS